MGSYGCNGMLEFNFKVEVTRQVAGKSKMFEM